MLNDKVAVITGGTRGIGYATAKKFLEEGAIVVIFGHGETSVSRALNMLIEDNPKYNVIGMCPDLTNSKMLSDAMREIFKKYGKIDILINNAGINSDKGLLNYEEDEYDNVMSINLEGTVNATKTVVEFMPESGGTILNISSSVSFYGNKLGFIYTASKEAINGLTKSLAIELAPKKIRVNAVAPGLIHTDMLDTLSQEELENLVHISPMERLGEPSEVANVLAFLASDGASFVNGAIVPVDGACKY